ncbi:MAG TPA: MucR family transcriptional regulator [Allosphingosinicella sp.]|jgi:predicted transcriptional regulator
MEHQQLIELTADIVAAHVAYNRVAVGEIGDLVAQVHGALTGLGAPPPAPPQDDRKVGAVSVRASVKPDHLVCLACGRKQKTLKRHLATAHRLTPAQYRADYRLPDSYPMVAPDYARQRREMAIKIGLGQKGRGRRKAAKPAARGKTAAGRGKAR